MGGESGNSDIVPGAQGRKSLFSGRQNEPKHKVLGQDIPRTTGLISGRTSRPKNAHPIARSAGFFICADVLDPKARTSMTRGVSKNVVHAGKHRADFFVLCACVTKLWLNDVSEFIRFVSLAEFIRFASLASPLLGNNLRKP